MNFKTLVKGLQIKLNEMGEKLTVDGDLGPKTQAALEKYDVSIELVRAIKDPPPIRPVPTPPPVAEQPPPKPGAPIYPKPHPFHPRFEKQLPAPYTHLHPLDILRSVAGEKEVLGSKDNPLIAHFHEHSGNLGSHSEGADYHDEVPHCASAMNWAADMAGCRKTNRADAKSWGTPYGNPRKGKWVEVGDLIHKKSGDQNHITMCNKRFNLEADETYEGFGSNQNNSIKTSTYQTSEIKSIQVWDPLPGTVLAPIGILGHKPVASSGSNSEGTV